MKIQDKCALNQIIESLNQLKLKGIYDSSLIIISADHGYWKMSDCMNHVNLKIMTNSLIEMSSAPKKVC